MKLVDLVKTLLRSFARAIFRILYSRWTSSEQERKKRSLENGYSIFCQMSENKGIQKIVFRDGAAVIAFSDGRRYHFNATDRVARMYSVPYTGTFEAKETEFVRNFIRAGQICFDIGASFGWYTILLSQSVGYDGQVHAFEPLPQAVEILENNVRLNGCKNVTVNRIALDETSGEKELYLPDIGVSGSFRLHEYTKAFQVFKCPSLRLDDYCRKKGIRDVDFIKADIEGAEWQMLKGATEILQNNQPVLLLEVQKKSTSLFGYQPADLFDWLSNFGYATHYCDSDGQLVPVENSQETLPDYNFFFLPRDRR